MQATNPGTFIYHGHIRLTSVNLFGMLIIEDAVPGKFPNWPVMIPNEANILFGDAWTKRSNELLDGLKAENFTWIGNPQVVLTNGRTRYPGTSATVPEGCGHPVIKIASNDYTLVRFASATTLGFMSVAVEGHKFIVLQADLMYVQPYETRVLEINAGQRYDVVLVRDDATAYDTFPGKPDAAREAYWIHSKIIGRANGTETWSVLSYDDAEPALRLMDPPENWGSVCAVPVQRRAGMEYDLKPFAGSPRPVPKADVEHVIRVTQARIRNNSGPTQWQLNGYGRFTPLKYPHLWYAYELTKMKNKGATPKQLQDWLAQEIPDETQRPLIFEQGQVVQFVVQNGVGTSGTCEYHPLHLHYGEFAVMGHGDGAYVPGSIPINYVPKVNETMWRDTQSAYVSNYSYLDPKGVTNDKCGWTAFRGELTTTGASIVHCHISAHMAIGMVYYFLVLPKVGNQMPPLKEIPGYPTTSSNLVVDCEEYMTDVDDGIDA